MDIAKTYWLLKDNVNQPKADYYKHSDKTPYERGIDALDYYRYYGGKPLNIEKTYLNRLIMPIYDDLDIFQLKITKIFLKMKEFQDNFNGDETTKELLNLSKTVSILLKENIKDRKNFSKNIVSEFKSTHKDVKEILEEGMKKRGIIKPFLQFMEHRELDDQDLMNNIRLKFRSNCERIRKFKETMLAEDNLKEMIGTDREVEKFNDYLVDFQKQLESKTRRMKIERLKMKVNDIQLENEKEMMKKKEIPKIKRNITFCGFYTYNDRKEISENKNVEYKINNKISKNNSSFSRFLKSKLGDEY
jgi:hypothetical protein